MTIAPENIGDKGQRYEVQAFGFPRAGEWHAVGWCQTLEAAEKMETAAMLHPSCEAVKIIDREAKP